MKTIVSRHSTGFFPGGYKFVVLHWEMPFNDRFVVSSPETHRKIKVNMGSKFVVGDALSILCGRLLLSFRLIPCVMTARQHQRHHHYDRIITSKKAEQRKPLTLVSLSMRMFNAVEEIANAASITLETATVGARQQLLTQAFDEYNGFETAATNMNYKLDARTQKAITNLLVHVSPLAFKAMQDIYDSFSDDVTIYSIDTLSSPGTMIYSFSTPHAKFKAIGCIEMIISI